MQEVQGTLTCPPTPPHPISSVATCNVVNDPRDLSSMAIYHVRSTRNVNMPPTPPHSTPQSRYSKTCVLRERFSVRRHRYIQYIYNRYIYIYMYIHDNIHIWYTHIYNICIHMIYMTTWVYVCMYIYIYIIYIYMVTYLQFAQSKVNVHKIYNMWSAWDYHHYHGDHLCHRCHNSWSPLKSAFPEVLNVPLARSYKDYKG